MLLVLIFGLWAVLAIGARLSAPEDLAGKWQLQSQVRGIPDDTLTIEQSGRFFQVSFEHGPHLDLKLEDNSQPLRLVHGDTTLTISGEPGDDKIMQLTGPNPHWTAHRVVRTYPADTTGKESH
jgi:hypothetical protein